MIGADTDIPNAKLGNYYLDAAVPPPGQIQCGGDGKSLGASGFGILGPTTPNTDPRTPGFNRLTVKRTRYFSRPGGGVALARRYTQRVTRPLTGTASPMP